jgi:hypothetical protein
MEDESLNSVSGRQRIFLLSPANLAGIRASRLMAKDAKSDLACRLRQEGVPVGELFSFVSSLYFRGKLAYAQAFSAAPQGISGVFIITSDCGLVPPDTRFTLDRLLEIAKTNIDCAEQRYRAPLVRDCRLLLETTGIECDAVLLGSIATSKYVEPLLEIFGERLLFPQEFAGRGDMSRGGLMLRAVEKDEELTYVPVLSAKRNGPRPAKLAPMKYPARLSQTPASHEPTISQKRAAQK